MPSASTVVSPSVKAARLAVIALLAQAGCALHLHNAQNAKTANDAIDAFKAADVQSFVAAEREAAQATQERDLVATRRNVRALRDAFLVAALSPQQSLQAIRHDVVAHRLAVLGFARDRETQRTLHGLKDQRAMALALRDQCALAALKTGKKIPPASFPPSADDERAVAEVNDPTLNSLFSAYKSASDQYVASMNSLTGLSGKIGEANAKLQAAWDLSSNVATEVEVLNTELKKAIEDYKRAKQSAERSAKALEEYSRKIEDALKAFDSAENALKTASKGLGLQDLVADIPLEKLKAQRDQIGTFMAAFSKSQEDDTHAARSDAEFAGQVAGIVARSSAAISQSSARAQLVPLIFEQDRLRIEIDRLQRMASRGKTRVALLEGQRDAYVNEAMNLVDADNSLQRAAGGDMSARLGALARAGNQDALHAIFVVSTSIAVSRLHEDETEVMLIGLDHDQALDASEFSLRLWQHTIAAPLEQLVAYHESGITADDIAKLLQAASLAGVAVGVNR